LDADADRERGGKVVRNIPFAHRQPVSHRLAWSETQKDNLVKTFFRLDSNRVTFREHAFDNPWLLVVPLFGIFKLLRIPTVGSSDDPPVETLSPFEVQEAELPEEVRERFAPLTGELAALGFGGPIFHQIYCPLQHTYIYWATFAHATGRAAARIHHRIWSRPNLHKSYLFPVFISEMSDGSFLVSTSGKPDFIAPKSVDIHYDTGASAAELWREHERRLDDRLPGRSVDVRSPDRVRQMVERHHAALRDFHVGRGVFRPVGDEEQEKLARRSDARPAATHSASVEDAVLTLLRARQRTQQPSWRNFVVILVLSLLAFLAAGLKDVDRTFLLLLVPILLFHELGHYVAMRWFGYRNLRMFFIPFFGAAVAGKHYNIAGWKKAIVALAGPVPGILVGVALGVAGMLWSQPKLTEAAVLMTVVNGLNLLPFLPLDGGWVLHAVLFCRHPLLDMAFRLVAVVAFFGLALLIGGHLWLLGVLLLIGLPAAWHKASVAQRLRRREAIAVSPDDVSIPEGAARTILAELGAGKHSRKSANILAQQVTSVFETLNARPPGVLASVALLGAQGGSFLLVLVFTVVFMLFRHGPLFANRFVPHEAPMPYRYGPGNTEQWAAKETTFLSKAPPAGKESGVAPLDVVTLIAGYPDEATARAEFAELPALDRGMGPGHGAVVRLFGQTVLVTLPKDDDLTRKRWKDWLDQTAKEVTVGDKDSFVFFHVSCTLPSEKDAEQLVQELDAHFLFARQHLLLPAWSPAWETIPPQQRQKLLRARRTLGRLASVQRRAYQEPEVKAATDEFAKSMQSRDPQEGREFIEAQAKAVQAAVEAAQERLVAEIAADKSEVDQAVVDLWQRLAKIQKDERTAFHDPDRTAAKKNAEARERQRDTIYREMAEHVGSLAFIAGSGAGSGAGTETKANLSGCTNAAGIHQQGRTVTLNALSFRCPAFGLPALGEWLGRQGAGEIRYGYEAEPTYDGQGPDDDS
jgi:Zn-dependent protease